MRTFLKVTALLTLCQILYFAGVISRDISLAATTEYIAVPTDVTLYRDCHPRAENVDSIYFTIPASYYVSILDDTDYALDHNRALSEEYVYCEYMGVRGCIRRSDIEGCVTLRGITDPYYEATLYTCRNTRFRRLLSSDVLDVDLPVDTPLDYVGYLKVDDTTYYYVSIHRKDETVYGYLTAADTTDGTIATSIPLHKNARSTAAIATPADPNDAETVESDSIENLLLTAVIIGITLLILFVFLFYGRPKKKSQKGNQ